MSIVEVLPLPENDDENYVRRPSGIATDSYSNPPARLGLGSPNLAETGGYPIVRITEFYPLILSLYRSSWIVRRVIDTVANDMFKTFPVLNSDLDAMQVRMFNKVIGATRTVPRLKSACKWGRLFGGAACVIVIDGEDDLSQPLNIDDIKIGSYRGLIALDRWSGIIAGPEINADINDPDGFGLPTYYSITMNAGTTKVHHSRVLRFTGRELPQWEVQTELYWGMSEIEIIFDELRKRDYSSWNIVSLLTRAQVLAISEPQLASLMSGLNGTEKAYASFVERMEATSEQLNNQGLLILGKDGKLEQKNYSFGGVSDVYHEFMKDLAAATGIPYEIIFGREGGIGGSEIGNNGMSSLQIYDNLIDEKRTAEANPIIDKLLPVICMSTFGEIPDELQYNWSPIRAISDKERSDLGKALTESVLMAYNADLITKKEARAELAKQSGTNGLFSHITQESIAETPDTYASETEFFGPDYQGSGDNKKPGAREGENIPVEAKPIGVTGLKWHKARRISGPGQAPPRTLGSGGDIGSGGAGSKGGTKSLRQTIAHGVKHMLKKRPAQDSEPCVACESGDCGLHGEI